LLFVCEGRAITCCFCLVESPKGMRGHLFFVEI